MPTNQKTKKQIFLVYACDSWKSTSSMKQPIMVTTSVRKLKSFIAKKIKAGDFIYTHGTAMSETKQAAMFRADFETLTMREINDCLVYGFYEYVYDGEEI